MSSQWGKVVCVLGGGRVLLLVVTLMSYVNISENQIPKTLSVNLEPLLLPTNNQTLGIYEHWAHRWGWEWWGCQAFEFLPLGPVGYWPHGLSPMAKFLRAREELALLWMQPPIYKLWTAQQHLNSHDEKLDVFSRYNEGGRFLKLSV